jgi:small GTP-binding protein
MVPTFKICLIGPESVGKTSLIRRFTRRAFDPQYTRTLGVEISKGEIPLGPGSADATAVFVIWDIMGDYDLFSEVADAYLLGAKGIMAVLDVTRRETVEGLRRWVQETKLKAGKAAGVVVGNKVDLEGQRQVREEEFKELSGELGWAYAETSALTGTGVENAFGRLADELVRRSSRRPSA